jgi:Meiotically Up-regulated Gene 113 (MUG113) protein
MRFFLVGNRPLRGLIRPSVNFGPEDRRALRGCPAQAAVTERGAFVYILRGLAGCSKIGVSSDPSSCLAKLQTSSEVPLSFAAIYAPDCDANGAYAIEAEAQARLSAYRIFGEWFAIPEGMAANAVAAAAHRQDVKVANIDPARIDDVLRGLAVANSSASESSSPSMHGAWFISGVLFAASAFFFAALVAGLLLLR